MKAFIKLLVILLFTASCETSFLDVGSDKSNVIPQSLQDFQAMLDNTSVMNTFSAHRIALIATDEYTISDARWGLLSSTLEKSVHTWQNYGNEDVDDWNYSYKRILYSNIILEGLQKLNGVEKGKQEWKHINGAAHFFRALSYFELVQQFCKTYDPSTAGTDLGLPLKTSSDIENVPQRSTLKETYDLILADIKTAMEQLPDAQIVKERPIKQAATALLSRVSLFMADYESALRYAEMALQIESGLTDYNSIDISARYPFPRRGIGNKEVIFTYKTGSPTILNSSTFNASEKFLSYYGENDLRKKAFFFDNADGRKLFKGSYGGEYQCFTGLSVNELYLNAAEAAIRIKRKDVALLYLNTLCRHRIKSYIDFEIGDFAEDKDILQLILLERRKELYRRGLHWGDLKRLNHEGIFKDTLRRVVNGEIYELLPNSPIYVWPIPYQVVELSGIEQN